MQSKHLSRVIAAAPAAVYAFAAEPGNLAKWASGLAQSEVTRIDGGLVAESPMGRVVVTFAPCNELGVLDHDVRLPSGEVVHNPLRVVAHPLGAEIIFTVRQLGLSDAEFDRDAATVAADLDTLKELFESTAGRFNAGPS